MVDRKMLWLTSASATLALMLMTTWYTKSGG